MHSRNEQLDLFSTRKAKSAVPGDRVAEVEKITLKLARSYGFRVDSVRWKNNRRVMASVGRDGILNLQNIYGRADRKDLSILVKVMAGKADSSEWESFKEYIQKHLPKELDEVRSRLTVLPPKGLFHDLNKALKVVLPLLSRQPNPMPKVGWSTVRVGKHGITWGTHRDMPEGNLILVNSVLDSHDVPSFVVEHIVWHEICHDVMPPENGSNGRRLVHSKIFREMEHRYPKARLAEEWEIKNVSALIRRHQSHRKRRKR
jgi:hypothetical protein